SDLTQIRTMMERSTKFLSLAGWSGIMAGIYGLAATVISIQLINATGSDAIILYPGQQAADIFILAVVTLVLALVTIIGFSLRKSRNKGETAWNPAARRLAFNMAIPLMAGAILIA